MTTVLTLCVCVCVCMSPVCWHHNRFIQAAVLNATIGYSLNFLGFQLTVFRQLKLFSSFSVAIIYHTVAILTTRPRSKFNVTTLYRERINSVCLLARVYLLREGRESIEPHT